MKNDRTGGQPGLYQPRTYRKLINSPDLVRFRVVVRETDLFISAQTDLSDKAQDLTRRYYQQIEKYISRRPEFASSFVPLNVPSGAPQIIKAMAEAGFLAGVGPMAAVAGAMAEFVGKRLLKYTPQVIVENGGDIFLDSIKERKVLIYAGTSKFSQRLGLKIDGDDTPCGVCTSSGTVGYSFSYGQADAVVVVARSATLADAFATAICNQVKSNENIEKGLALARENANHIDGVVIIIADKLGSWGRIELVQTPQNFRILDIQDVG